MHEADARGIGRGSVWRDLALHQTGIEEKAKQRHTATPVAGLEMVL